MQIWHGITLTMYMRGLVRLVLKVDAENYTLFGGTKQTQNFCGGTEFNFKDWACTCNVS